ncbi:hypothetical protein ACUV84_040508 [Puccinellia chinampoensis]
MAAAAAAAGAALGDVNLKQKPNPSATRPGLRSPVALAYTTNTGRTNPGRPISVGDVLKENAKLRQLLAQKIKIIELSSIQNNNLRYALLTTRQQNLTLAQTNSQITAELNQGKYRLKVLQHELACTTSVLKLKGSGLERKSTTADNQLQKEVASQEEKNAAASELAPVETQHSVPCNTVLEEALPAKTNKRNTLRRRSSRLNPGSCEMVASKWKLESCEAQKDSNIEEDITTKLRSISSEPLHHTRKPLRRKSSRVNQGSCEVTEGTLESAREDSVAPLPPSSSKIFIEQKETEEQNDRRPSTKPSEEQATGRRSSVEVTGRRSSMRGAAKVISYKEIPLNVKMRRP